MSTQTYMYGRCFLILRVYDLNFTAAIHVRRTHLIISVVSLFVMLIFILLLYVSSLKHWRTQTYGASASDYVATKQYSLNTYCITIEVLAVTVMALVTCEVEADHSTRN